MNTELEFDSAMHRYTLNGVVIPSVTQILESSGISDFSGVPPEILQRAQERGTAVHTACWYDDQGDLDELSLSPELIGYLEAWRKFRKEQPVVIKSIESRFYSPVGYAGTPDRVVIMPKWGESLLDIKTGEETASWRIQLAAYVKGLFPVGVKHRGAVKLSKDGTYSIRWYSPTDFTRDWNVFAGALTVYKYRKEYGIL